MIPAPAEFAWLAQPLGDEAALLALIERYGGTRVHVPRQVTRDWAALLGEAPAAGLVSAFGGQEFTVPLAKRWRIQVYYARGQSASAIARTLIVSEDTVWRALRAQRDSERREQARRGQTSLPL